MMNNQFHLVDRFDGGDLSILIVGHGTDRWSIISTASGLDKVIDQANGAILDGDDDLVPPTLLQFLAEIL